MSAPVQARSITDFYRQVAEQGFTNQAGQSRCLVDQVLVVPHGVDELPLNEVALNDDRYAARLQTRQHYADLAPRLGAGEQFAGNAASALRPRAYQVGPYVTAHVAGIGEGANPVDLAQIQQQGYEAAGAAMGAHVLVPRVRLEIVNTGLGANPSKTEPGAFDEVFGNLHAGVLLADQEAHPTRGEPGMAQLLEDATREGFSGFQHYVFTPVNATREGTSTYGQGVRTVDTLSDSVGRELEVRGVKWYRTGVFSGAAKLPAATAEDTTQLIAESRAGFVTAWRAFKAAGAETGSTLTGLFPWPGEQYVPAGQHLGEGTDLATAHRYFGGAANGAFIARNVRVGSGPGETNAAP